MFQSPFICAPPPHPPWRLSRTIPPLYLSLDKRIMKIWKENCKNIHKSQNWSSIFFLIRILIPIKFYRVTPSPTPATPPPFLVANPTGGGCQHTRLETPSRRFRCHCSLHVPPIRPICHPSYLSSTSVSWRLLPLICFLPDSCIWSQELYRCSQGRHVFISIVTSEQRQGEWSQKENEENGYIGENRESR